MASKSKKKFKPVQFDKKPQPKLKFSFKLVLWIWILILVAFFLCYLLLANFTDAFIKTGKKSDSSNNVEQSTDLEDSNSTTVAVNPVPANADKQGSAYLSNCEFIGDEILSGLADCGVSSTHLDCGTSYILTNILESGITVSDKNIYLMLGYTELPEQSADSLIQTYDEVIRMFKSNCPDSDIYVMALPPVSDTCTTILNSSIDNFNSELLTLANNESVYYIDTNTVLKDNSGYLASDYIEDDSLSSSAYSKIADYVLSHTAQ